MHTANYSHLSPRGNRERTSGWPRPVELVHLASAFPSVTLKSTATRKNKIQDQSDHGVTPPGCFCRGTKDSIFAPRPDPNSHPPCQSCSKATELPTATPSHLLPPGFKDTGTLPTRECSWESRSVRLAYMTALPQQQPLEGVSREPVNPLG